MNYFNQVLTKYFEFNSRARRNEYWHYILFNLIISLILLFVYSIIDCYGILTIWYYLAFLVASLAVCLRTLYLISHSGCIILIALIPFIGSIILLVFFAIESDYNENQYGISP